MLIGQFKLALREHHAARFHTANLADLKCQIDAGDIGARRRKNARQPLTRIRRTAHHLHRLTGPGVHLQHAQPIRIGMLLGAHHLGDHKRRIECPVIHLFDLKADAGECVDNRGKVGVGLKMILEPGKGELHGLGRSEIREKLLGRQIARNGFACKDWPGRTLGYTTAHVETCLYGNARFCRSDLAGTGWPGPRDYRLLHPRPGTCRTGDGTAPLAGARAGRRSGHPGFSSGQSERARRRRRALLTFRPMPPSLSPMA
jgi:hypothetical protein